MSRNMIIGTLGGCLQVASLLAGIALLSIGLLSDNFVIGIVVGIALILFALSLRFILRIFEKG